MSHLFLDQNSFRQQGLWEQRCSEDCILWDICGGSWTAPCGCVYTSEAQRYHCETCDIQCRERTTPQNTFFPADDFVAQTRAGLPLDLLHLIQHPLSMPFPLLIPTRTNEYIPLIRDKRLPLRWVAVDAKELFTQHIYSPAQPRSYLQTPEQVRTRLRVDSNCNVLGILNGNDRALEGFWGMPRRAFFRQLESCGFIGVTGPTFSIIPESDSLPASHNVLMLMRHNRVMEEVATTTLTPIPNIYWRNMRDRYKWVEWLTNNGSIHVISRDFSRTKQQKSFRPEFEELLEILGAVKRPLHVLMPGVSFGKAKQVFKELDALSCTASIVTASPVMKAMEGGKQLIFRGSEPPVEIKSHRVARGELVWRNIEVIERYFLELVSTLETYHSISRESLRCSNIRPSLIFEDVIQL